MPSPSMGGRTAAYRRSSEGRVPGSVVLGVTGERAILPDDELPATPPARDPDLVHRRFTDLLPVGASG
ncbi:hypothetical protein AB0F43_08260 [Kribbella sp. NPDC023972]|uniref:hypothetical protein n=1 Tax=Kribbella sp. NPDC023972 TaxID=3154795 RepID=UPI0034095B4A